METRTMIAAGLLLVGAGAVGYTLLNKSRLGPSGLATGFTADLQPGAPLARGTHEQTVTLRWTAAANSPAAVLVQGVTIYNGVVTGHWWKSMDVARQGVQLWNSGDLAGAAQMAMMPANRQVAGMVSGGRGSATLYEFLEIVPGEEWWWYLRAPGAPLVQDAVGTKASALPVPDFKLPLVVM